MNGERLYINGNQLKLNSNSTIAYTMQVNDIANFSSRQSSFTKTINIPRTPENTKIMEYLGIVGNTSIVPYQKNVINYYIDNECIIFDGWGIIKESDNDSYQLVIYDGVVDLFKAIENKTLADLDIIELNHSKTLSSVIGSWDSTNNLNYKYILADYNGKAKYDSGNKFNIDYLVPSVKVSYLMDKIFDKYDMTYQGDIFNTSDFQELYMTFPKGVYTLLDEANMFSSSNINFMTNAGGTVRTRLITYNGYTAFSGTSVINNVHVRIQEAGEYRIKISGALKYKQASNVNNASRLGIAYNTNVANTNPDAVGMSVNSWFHYFLPFGTPFAVNQIRTFAANESFCLMAGSTYQMYIDEGSYLNVDITKIDNNSIDFIEAFSQFKTTDFLKEITWRYGLTIFKDKYTQNYQFLTLDERLNQADILDWSDNFVSLKNEKYIYGDYGQKNILHHKYNDDNSTYNDGYLTVLNKNLDDEKKLIDSKIYSPEKNLNDIDFPFDSHIYKLWDKEVDENDGVQEVKYKSLDKRFYFLKAKPFIFSGSSVTLGSEVLMTSTSISSAYTENYSGVSYNDVSTNYYSDFTSILNNTKVISAKVFLNESEISTFDFKKLYNINQLGGKFIVNKISNWQPKKLTEVELIKVHNDVQRPVITGTTGGLYITITGITYTSVNTWTRNINIHYITNVPDTYLIPVFVNNDTYTFPTIMNTSPYVFFDMINNANGFTSLTLTSMDGTVVSNSVQWFG